MLSILSSRFFQIRRWLVSWTHNRDHLLALVVFLGGLCLLPLRFVFGHIFARTVPPILILAAVAYLCAVRWLSPEIQLGAKTASKPSNSNSTSVPTLPIWAGRVAPIIVCWLLTAAFIITFYNATMLGTRAPPSWGIQFDIGRGLGIYLLTAIAGSFVLAQIAFVDEHDFVPGFLLAQLLAVCGVLRFSTFILTPSYIGVDIFTHAMNYAAVLLETGSLQAALGGSKYIAAPFYHLVVVVTALLGNTGLQWGVYLSVGIGMLLTPVIVYCSACYLPGVGPRWALFGAALFGLMDYITYWTLHAIPSSLALVFALGVLMLIIRILTPLNEFQVFTPHRGTTACIVILSLGVVLTDQVTSFILLVILGTAVGVQLVFYIRSWLLTFVLEDRNVHSARTQSFRLRDMITYAVFVLGLTLFVWAFTPYYGSTFTGSVIQTLSQTVTASLGDAGLFAHSLSGSVSGGTSGTGSGGAPPIGAMLMAYISQLGFLLLLGASAIGTCAIIRRYPQSVPDQANSTLIVVTAVIGTFAFVPSLLGIGTFLTGRWYALLYAGMGLLVASGFAQLWTNDLIKTRKMGSQTGSITHSHSRTRVNTDDGNQSSHVQYQPLVACLLIIVCLHPLVGAMSIDATLDAPIRDNHQPRYAFTGPEEQAAETLIDITESSANQPIYTDSEYAMRLTRPDPGPSDYYTAVIGESGAPADHDRVVYRQYQFEGAPSFVNSTTGETRVWQLSQGTINEKGLRSICLSDQQILYNNQYVKYCS